MIRASACALVLATISVAGFGGDKPLAWPQFRGPGGSGVADGQNPPVEIGPEKNVKWKVPVPSGASSPVVIGDKLILTAFDEGRLFTIAYERASGREIWRTHAPARELERFHKTEGSPAASTVATDGERIVSYFGSCGIFCYDLQGKELWKFEMPPASTISDFGSGVSPIIAAGTVILVRDELKDPKIIALDAVTGEIRWEKPRQSFSAFCTPVVWTTSAGRQVAVAGYGRMIGYDLQSGDEKWSVAGMPACCCPSPVVEGDRLFFAGWSPGDAEEPEFRLPSFEQMLKQEDADGDGVLTREEFNRTMMKGFFDNNDRNKDGKFTRDEWEALLKYMAASKNSAFAIRAGATGELTKSHVVWITTKNLPYVPSGILYCGQYVVVKDGGVVTAYDAQTGAIIHQGRAVASGRYYASPVAADGRIYFASLDEGAVTVLKAGSEKAEVLAKNPPLGERLAATPAIADDTLYVRTAGHLYAFSNEE